MYTGPKKATYEAHCIVLLAWWNGSAAVVAVAFGKSYAAYVRINLFLVYTSCHW